MLHKVQDKVDVQTHFPYLFCHFIFLCLYSSQMVLYIASAAMLSLHKILCNTYGLEIIIKSPDSYMQILSPVLPWKPLELHHAPN